jgi:hypothetical protein
MKASLRHTLTLVEPVRRRPLHSGVEMQLRTALFDGV